MELRQLRQPRLYIFAACFVFSVCLLFATRPYLPERFRHFTPPKFGHHHPPGPPRPPPPPPPPPFPGTDSRPTGPCVGARGTSLVNDPSSDDLPHPVSGLPNTTYPEPTFGSYEAIGLEQTWMTFDQRYGPYGYGEDSDVYALNRADWSTVDWGRLQDQCLLSRENRFHGNEFPQTGAKPRFRFVDDEVVEKSQGGNTGRQAIVLRTWSTYQYMPEDLWNIRSIITEASLATYGEYTVFLLVDVKREDGERIHIDNDFYQEVLRECVPEEFWGIAVLFHKSLQTSWYEKVGEIRPIFQIMQPLQLFAHFYPEFDHFWQLEMDSRITGDVGKMLQAFHNFSTRMPYKQARERASFSYMPRVHGDYEEFSAKVDEALEGGATVWGPVKIDPIDPVGPTPLVEDPKEDSFEWGVGWEADLVLLTPMFDVLRFSTIDDWVFKDWVGNGLTKDMPRFQAAPAQARASRTLLEAIHAAQHETGIYIASEATLPSFALWHGLKVVGMPIPKYQFPERDLRELNILHNGRPIRDLKDGIANGVAPYEKHIVEWYARPMTYQWTSSLPKPVFEHWMNEASNEMKRSAATNAEIPDELPPFLAEVDRKIYAPGFMMHPRKTNRQP